MAIAVSLLALLSACASAPPLARLPRGTNLSIDVARDPRATGTIVIYNKEISANAADGAAPGVVLGALSGLSCGPFAFVCVPFGAMVGGGAGSVAGAAVGLTGALSDETAATVRARLAQARQAHDLVQDLGRDLAERAGSQWNLTADAPAHRLQVLVQDVALTSTRDARISFAIRLQVRSLAPGGAQDAAAPAKVFEYAAPFMSLADWLDEGGDVLGENLRIASRQLALQIVSELTVH